MKRNNINETSLSTQQNILEALSESFKIFHFRLTTQDEDLVRGDPTDTSESISMNFGMIHNPKNPTSAPNKAWWETFQQMNA